MVVGTVGTFLLSLLLPRSIEQKRENVTLSHSIHITRTSTEQSSNVELVSVNILSEDSDSEQENRRDITDKIIS